MRSKYDKDDNNYIYIYGVPFRFLSFRGNAANLRIGISRQLVFIPRRYFNKDGTLINPETVDSDLNWWFHKPVNQHKIELYREEVKEYESK